MEIEKLGSGCYRVTVSLGRSPDGKRVRVRKTFKRRKNAARWGRAQEEAKDAGTLTATSETVGEWLTTWMEVRKPDLSPNTYRTESETSEKRVRPGLAHVRLRDLTAVSIEKWLAGLASSGTTQNERRKAAKLLRTALNDAARRRLIPFSPMRGAVKVPRQESAESVALDHGQLAGLLSAAGDAGTEALFRLWADAGLRPGELFGLKADDFDPAAGTVAVRRSVCITSGKLRAPKTRRSRRLLLLAPSTVAAMKNRPTLQVSADAPLFGTPTGKHWAHRNFLRDVFYPVTRAARLAKTADRKAICKPYTLRHTMATMLLQAGVSLKVVSERLGHEDVTTTLKSYAHILPGMQEQAALAMELILNPPPKQVPDSGT